MHTKLKFKHCLKKIEIYSKKKKKEAIYTLRKTKQIKLKKKF